VKLPSGGALVIDPTEALVSIDINSARATKGSDIEETALQTNLEAAEEIARQLRLRDIGGLIVIDFIDMTPAKNQRAVEDRMRECLEADRARVQVGRISRFGLLEMSRQRLRPSLGESSGVVCPRCNGQGIIRDVESLSLAILRLIEEEALKDRTAEVRARVPFQVAAFLLNEKRNAITKIELRTRVRIFILPDDHLETPNFEVMRLRDDSPEALSGQSSYEMAHEESEEVPQPVTATRSLVREEAAVKTSSSERVAPPPSAQAAAPATIAKAQPSLFKGLVKSLVGLFASEEAPAEQAAKPAAQGERSNANRNNERRNERQQSNNRRRDNTRNNRDDERKPRDTARDNSSERDTTQRDTSSNNRDNNTDSRRERPQREERPARNERNERPTRELRPARDTAEPRNTRSHQAPETGTDDKPRSARPQRELRPAIDERPARTERQNNATQNKPNLDAESEELLDVNLPEQNNEQDDTNSDDDRPRRRSRGQRRRSNRRERQREDHVDSDNNTTDDSAAEQTATESAETNPASATEEKATQTHRDATADTQKPASNAAAVTASTAASVKIEDEPSVPSKATPVSRGAVEIVDPAQAVALTADQPLLQISEPAKSATSTEQAKRAAEQVDLPLEPKAVPASMPQPTAEHTSEPATKAHAQPAIDTAKATVKADALEKTTQPVSAPAAEEKPEQPVRPVGRASNDPRERRRLERLAREAEAAKTAAPQAVETPVAAEPKPAPVAEVQATQAQPADSNSIQQDLLSPSAAAEAEPHQTADQQEQPSKHDDAPAAEQDENKPHA
jgi:ribonuclease E